MSFLSFLLQSGVIDNNMYSMLGEKYFYENIEEILLNTTALTEHDIVKLKAKYYNMQYIRDEELQVQDIYIDSYIYATLIKCTAIPYNNSKNDICIAISEPGNVLSLDVLKNLFQNKTLHFTVARQETIKLLLNNYAKDNKTCIDSILQDAVLKNASDIHITPYEKIAIIKYRIDGELITNKIIQINDYSEFCIAIKVAASLDISDTRHAQSGHYQDKKIDYRVSIHPTIYGEKINIRILNKNTNFISLEKIGFSAEQIQYLKRIVQEKHGMIIFCGPTGSGKTTSVYSLLNTINKQTRNIMTLEDPVEYKMHGICQTEIKSEIFDFATGIKSLLRQDPDVIFVGEIRDAETASMAVRASMTGHLVFTTIHANDTFGAIQRFIDFGIPKYIITDNIISIISQRLVKAKPSGRTIISEILQMTDSIRNAILNNTTKSQLIEYAKQEINFATIKDDYINKLKLGIIYDDNI